MFKVTIYYRKKTDKLKKDLEEAAREGGSRSSGGSGGSSEEKIIDSMPYYTTTLPSKVALRFVSTSSVHISSQLDIGLSQYTPMSPVFGSSHSVFLPPLTLSSDLRST